MSEKISIYLDNNEQLRQLSDLAFRLGYVRQVGAIELANLSAFVRGIAEGEVVVTPKVDPRGWEGAGHE
jgi:hypothetical protein